MVCIVLILRGTWHAFFGEYLEFGAFTCQYMMGAIAEERPFCLQLLSFEIQHYSENCFDGRL